MKTKLSSMLVFAAITFSGFSGTAFAQAHFTKITKIPRTANKGQQVRSCTFNTSDNTAQGYATITFKLVEEGLAGGRSLIWTSSASERIWLPEGSSREALTTDEFLPLPKRPADQPVSTYHFRYEDNYTTESNILLDEMANMPKKNAAPEVDTLIGFIDQTCRV